MWGKFKTLYSEKIWWFMAVIIFLNFGSMVNFPTGSVYYSLFVLLLTFGNLMMTLISILEQGKKGW